MKVLNLCCSNGHGFEGWFASDADFVSQHERGLVECPLCTDKAVERRPTAPRLNLSGAREAPPQELQTVAKPAEPDLQAMWMKAVRQVLSRTEDVGPKFAEEARRIHYGEAEERGIRGKATREESEALREEGIEVMALPLPPGLDGPLQ